MSQSTELSLTGLWVAGILALAIGCSPETDPVRGDDRASHEVELAYVEWSTEIASSHVVEATLEDMGYAVELTAVSPAAMWEAVANGDVDGLVGAWLPRTHDDYLERVAGRVENLGPNLEETRIGLVIPQYVDDVETIPDLAAHRERFDGEIIGIEPGAGIMRLTETALEQYGLSGFEVRSGDDESMVQALAEAYQANRPIVVTGWTPHWMFQRFELRYLDDPQGVYGGGEFIATIVRQGLAADKPEVYALLDAFYWTLSDIQAVMLAQQQPEVTPREAARTWVAEHPERVADWRP